MGSNFSSREANSGGMVMDFDRSYYYAGDEVKGNLYLDLKENVDLSGIEFTIEIKEGTSFYTKDRHYHHHWHQEHSHRHDRYANVLKEGSKVLFKNTSILVNFSELSQIANKETDSNNPNRLVKGQYVFPFLFKIPFNLPGSFEYYDRNNEGYIKYTVTSKLISVKGPQHDITNTNLLVVRQSPQYFEYPISLTETRNLTSCCLFSQGQATLTVSYPKNHFSPDELIQVICTLDNSRSKIDAECITLELFQRITLKDDFRNTLYLTRKIGERRYEGHYMKGVESTRTLELYVTDYNNPSLKFFERCDHNNFFRDRTQISKLQASVKSDLIECSYYLRASVEYSFWNCCSQGPLITIPIIIYIPELNRNDILEFKPEDWAPLVLPAAEINFPDARDLGIEQGN